MRLHLPHVRHQVRRPDRRPVARDRRRRHRLLQDLPRLQEFLRRRRWRDVSDASVGQEARASSSPRIAKTPSWSAVCSRVLLAQGKTGPEWHEPSRPEAVEAEGTNRFATFLGITGAAGYVVHLSCKGALDAALAAKSRGVKIWVESVLPHLLLDKTYAERAGVEGMKHVMSPPLRDRGNQKVLWDALATGSIDTVATDHCPFDTSQKLLGKDAFTQIPNGIPGIEERVNLLYTYGVKRGTLDLHRFVDAASTRAAKLFGLFPRKGTIAVGSDADLVMFDPEYRGKISAATQHTNCDYSGFEGMEIEGRPSDCDGPGQGPGARRQVRGRARPRPVAETRACVFLKMTIDPQTNHRRAEGTPRADRRRKRRAADRLERHVAQGARVVHVETRRAAGRTSLRCRGQSLDHARRRIEQGPDPRQSSGFGAERRLARRLPRRDDRARSAARLRANE